MSDTLDDRACAEVTKCDPLFMVDDPDYRAAVERTALYAVTRLRLAAGDTWRVFVNAAPRWTKPGLHQVTRFLRWWLG